MKRTYLILTILTLIATALLLAGEKPFFYYDLTFGMSPQETLKAAGDSANCLHIKQKDTIICGNYHDAALKLVYSSSGLDEITVKKDIIDPGKTYKEELSRLTALYGKPVKESETKRTAVFDKDSSRAALWISKKGILLYFMCRNKECEPINDILRQMP